MRSYTTLRNTFGTLSLNASTSNLSLGDQLMNDAIRILANEFYFTEKSFTTTSVASQQFYNLPPDTRKVINVTGTIGNIVWVTKECPNRDYWDYLNVIPFTQDFPMFHFIWNKNTQVGIWPTPSSNGNTITVNYQGRVIDLSQADYTTGTVSVTNGNTTATFSGATLVQNMVGRWLQVTAPSGDNQWYQISGISGSTATLYGPYQGTTVSGASYTIGEMSVLPEDYQDLPLYRALEIYFTSIQPDRTQADLYQGLYERGYEQLKNDYGTKTTSPVLTDTEAPVVNPNLFQRL